MRICITGASGFVGSELVSFLNHKGDRISPLSRGELPKECDAVIHLAGENIASRWTAEKKKKIWDSRVDGTKRLVDAIVKLPQKPKVLISASAIGIYGDRGDELLDEESPLGEGFLAELGKEWEAATNPASAAGIRVVNIRIGIVLDPNGGALKKMLPAFKLGVGGALGSGRQWFSWIALKDLVSIIKFIISKGDLSGPVNAVSPRPVRNEELAKNLASALHRPCFCHVPAFAVRALFGEMADETVLISSKLIPQKLLNAGFSFSFPDVKSALLDELKS